MTAIGCAMRSRLRTCLCRERTMHWMILPYVRYFDFSGRSRRTEYWMFFLFYLLVCLVFAAIVIAGFASVNFVNDPTPSPLVWLGFGGLGLFILASIIPSIAVSVRRFHDQDLSGWMYLLGFIPYIGSIVVLVFMCIDGTRGDNRFGLDPKGRGLEGVFA
jgi:uncharacterized membrane protein YhaH (DUF805 family)